MLIPVTYNNRTPKYHINFSYPEEFQYGNDCNIGYTPWEYTKIPERKIEYLNRCDATWVTSEFVKKVCIDNGVQQDVHVLPHGVSLDWDVVDREVLDHFYFLLDNGGDIFFDVVYKTIDTFLKADLPCNVKLIVKTTADIDTSQIRGEGWYDKRVLLVDNFLPLEQYQKLYYKANALIYPSNGEGFGLIPYQAVATGMPTVTTNLTGCADYSEHTIYWKHTWEEARSIATDGNLYLDEDLGEWLEPDYEVLPELLHDVYENYHQHRQNASHSARIIRASSSWDDICDRMISLLELAG
jgi:glycosyltransferase involved in cell wall biosynthesis